MPKPVTVPGKSALVDEAETIGAVSMERDIGWLQIRSTRSYGCPDRRIERALAET
jgi:hypothetical protein